MACRIVFVLLLLVVLAGCQEDIQTPDVNDSSGAETICMADLGLSVSVAKSSISAGHPIDFKLAINNPSAVAFDTVFPGSCQFELKVVNEHGAVQNTDQECSAEPSSFHIEASQTQLRNVTWTGASEIGTYQVAAGFYNPGVGTEYLSEPISIEVTRPRLTDLGLVTTLSSNTTDYLNNISMTLEITNPLTVPVGVHFGSGCQITYAIIHEDGEVQTRSSICSLSPTFFQIDPLETQTKQMTMTTDLLPGKYQIAAGFYTGAEYIPEYYSDPVDLEITEPETESLSLHELELNFVALADTVVSGEPLFARLYIHNPHPTVISAWTSGYWHRILVSGEQGESIYNGYESNNTPQLFQIGPGETQDCLFLWEAHTEPGTYTLAGGFGIVNEEPAYFSEPVTVEVIAP